MLCAKLAAGLTATWLVPAEEDAGWLSHWGVLGVFPSEPLPRGSFCLEILSICKEIRYIKEMLFVAEAISVSALNHSGGVPPL